MKRAIIYVAWGDRFAREAESAYCNSDPIHKYPAYLITDSNVGTYAGFEDVIRPTNPAPGKRMKAEALACHLPEGYDSYLFLDTDTRVVEDAELGFQKAEKHGIAMAPAPFYSLADFHGFSRVMEAEGVAPIGQQLYNSGVVFFSPSEKVKTVLSMWFALMRKYDEKQTDQPYLTLAMEQQGVHPYALSRSWNYRAFGEMVAGDVYIWHSRRPVPTDVNTYHCAWPRTF